MRTTILPDGKAQSMVYQAFDHNWEFLELPISKDLVNRKAERNKASSTGARILEGWLEEAV